MRGSALIPCLLLLGLIGPGCEADVAEAPQVDAAPTAATGEMEWLDDEQRAAGVSHHRLAGRLVAPRGDVAALRKQARDAIVDRARSLGFVRLDNMQIEAGCEDDAPDATACTVKIVAIGSR